VRAWIEPERVHGTYWVPLGLMTGAVALASRRGRPLATSIGLVGALSIADELNIGRRPLRQVLRQRNAHNVLGRIDPPEPDGQVLVVHAHHDAAPTGVVFHPLVPKLLARAAGGLMERFAATPAPMWGAVIGPAAVAIGGLLGRRRVCRFGGVLAGAYAAAMANIGFSPTVPGANDNLSGVLALLELA
jgi:hypothetical protein